MEKYCAAALSGVPATDQPRMFNNLNRNASRVDHLLALHEQAANVSSMTNFGND
jgi:hypothetical protein